MNPTPLLALLFLTVGTAHPSLVCNVTPRVIHVGAFYSGVNVRVHGLAPAGSKVIVTVTGSDRDESFNRKMRFGPIWLNGGKVRISGAPSLFLRYSPQPLAALLSPDAIASRDLDEASLARRIHSDLSTRDVRADAALRADFLALKKDDNIYRFVDGGVVMGQSDSVEIPYSLEFHWPKKAPPAEYEVHVYQVADGAVVSETHLPLSVVRSGFPSWLAFLAGNRSSLYGVTAVLIALLAGFGIDFLSTRLFHSKRASAH
jgi:hypothetical protein